MIPLIQMEMQNAGWLDPKEFADIVSISQMTPGPIGINAATYVFSGCRNFWFDLCNTRSLSSIIFVNNRQKLFEKFNETA